MKKGIALLAWDFGFGWNSSSFLLLFYLEKKQFLVLSGITQEKEINREVKFDSFDSLNYVLK